VRFLQGFNHGAFDVLVQARACYRFELMTMLALGAFLPSTDPMTPLLETLPLFALYEATVVLLRLTERRRSGGKRSPDEARPSV
jgi:Sec-independent protein secretion pathway component TatC